MEIKTFNSFYYGQYIMNIDLYIQFVLCTQHPAPPDNQRNCACAKRNPAINAYNRHRGLQVKMMPNKMHVLLQWD